MSNRFEAPVVGMHFRPPAKDVINLLAGDTELLLERQPDNEYDPKAVKVMLYGFTAEGQHKDLFMRFKNDALSSPTDNQEELDRLQDPLWLGFVSAKTGHAAQIADFMDENKAPSWPAKLMFGMKGEPMIYIEMPEAGPKDSAEAAADTGPTGD